MSDDIRVGDRFLVAVEVQDTEDRPLVSAPLTGGRRALFSFRSDVLLAAKRLPRAIKVGDKVRDRAHVSAVVLGIHRDRAWVSYLPNENYATVPIAALTLADEGAS